MIAEKIKSARKALSALGGQVSEEVWSMVKCIQHELDDAADQVEEIEANWSVPTDAPQTTEPGALAQA